MRNLRFLKTALSAICAFMPAAVAYPQQTGSTADADGEAIFYDGFDDGRLDRNKWVPICRPQGTHDLSDISERMIEVKDGSLVIRSDKVDGRYLEG